MDTNRGPSPSDSGKLDQRPGSADSQLSKGSKNGEDGFARFENNSLSEDKKSPDREKSDNKVVVDMNGGGDYVLNSEKEINQEMEEKEGGYLTDESDTESDVEIDVKRDHDEDASDASSVALDKPGEGISHPRVARGFRREMSDDKDFGVESRASKRSVSFNHQQSADDFGSKHKSPAVKESFRRKTYDGREVSFVTIDTQTNWDWVNDATDGRGAQNLILQTGECRTSAGSKHRIDKPHIKSILVKPDSRGAHSRSKTDVTSSTPVDERGVSDFTPYSQPYSDEFGIPILELSTDTDDSSDDDSSKRDQDDRNFLPSIGPPQILQYIRESQMEDINVEDPLARQNKEATIDETDYPVDEFGWQVGMFGGECEFCGEPIKPFPSIEKQQKFPPEKLYCCEEYREFVQFATTTALELENETRNATKLISIKPHIHFGSKQDRKAAKERAVQRMRERELQRRQQEATGLQQNVYSSAVGAGGAGAGATSAGVNLPTVRTTQVSALKAIHGGGGLSYKDMAGQANRVGGLGGEVARQMKTINYQLSSQRCLEEGWTLRPPSPLLVDDGDYEVFIPEPLNPTMMGTGKLRERQLIQKYYEDGTKFLTIFPDGTGNIFYPSGKLAIAVTSVDLGQYIYVVHDDSPKHVVQATFEPNGYGSCYHGNGIVRIFFDQLGGLELDAYGGRRRKWTWKDPEFHVHAPPFQPICFGLNRYIGIRVMSQDNVILTLTAKKRSCRFNVGSRLKLVAPENLPPKEIDDAQLFLEEKVAYVESILDKVSTLLKFPKSPKLDKILPPIHVTSKLQRTERLRKEKRSAAGTPTARPGRSKGTFPVVTVN